MLPSNVVFKRDGTKSFKLRMAKPFYKTVHRGSPTVIFVSRNSNQGPSDVNNAVDGRTIPENRCLVFIYKTIDRGNHSGTSNAIYATADGAPFAPLQHEVTSCYYQARVLHRVTHLEQRAFVLIVQLLRVIGLFQEPEKLLIVQLLQTLLVTSLEQRVVRFNFLTIMDLFSLFHPKLHLSIHFLVISVVWLLHEGPG